jgi:hypothetical protein
MTSHARFDPESRYSVTLQAEAEAAVRQCVAGGLIVNPAGKVFVQRRSPHRNSGFRWVGPDDLEILKENRQADDNAIYRLVQRALELNALLKGM